MVNVIEDNEEDIMKVFESASKKLADESSDSDNKEYEFRESRDRQRLNRRWKMTQPTNGEV